MGSEVIAALIFRALLALLSFAPDPLVADAFRETAPDDLSPSAAVEHLAAARLAALAHGLDPADLLAIAHHESRYTNRVELEPTGYYSCGVMTPYDRARARCPAWTLTTLGGYIHGASHFAEWLRICRGLRVCALRGYSGNTWDTQTGNRGLRAWQVFDRRAARIRRAIGAR